MQQEEATANDTLEPATQRRRRLKDVDLDKVHQKFLMILEREVNRLLDESFAGPLSEESAKKLTNYLKFLPELREMEAEALDGLTDEELEKITKKTAKQGDTDERD